MYGHKRRHKKRRLFNSKTSNRKRGSLYRTEDSIRYHREPRTSYYQARQYPPRRYWPSYSANANRFARRSFGYATKYRPYRYEDPSSQLYDSIDDERGHKYYKLKPEYRGEFDGDYIWESEREYKKRHRNRWDRGQFRRDVQYGLGSFALDEIDKYKSRTPFEQQRVDNLSGTEWGYEKFANAARHIGASIIGTSIPATAAGLAAQFLPDTAPTVSSHLNPFNTKHRFW